MVDELMLRDIKNVLNKLQTIKNREDFENLLLLNGLTLDSNEEEINEFIIRKFMSERELELYKKYMLYKKKADLTNLVTAINSLQELTTNVASLYEESSKTKQTIKLINGIIDKVDSGLRGYPNIRVSTEYNKVKIDYKRYFDTYIKSGMKRATFTEEIERINNLSPIIKSLKKRKLKDLREGLAKHNRHSKLRIQQLYDKYISSREEYGTFLRELMTTLLKNNTTLYEAGVLSLYSMYSEDIPTITLATGVKVIDKSKIREISPEYIADKAFEFFQKSDEPEFDEVVFITKFREFLLHFYNSELRTLNKHCADIMNRIQMEFSTQKEVMTSLSYYQESIDLPANEKEKDIEDTLLLVYSNNRPNK